MAAPNQQRKSTNHTRKEAFKAPNSLLLALEFRAFWEFGAVLPSWPVLQLAPKGDGHCVVVFPGLSANDASTMPLRRYLESLGYEAHGWDQGFNFGPRAGVLDAAKKRVEGLAKRSGRPVSVIGWSLGGIYAREIAKELPNDVRNVISLGTPFAGSPRATNAWRLYELVSQRDVERETDNYDLPTAPSTPTTSIYSRTDGIVAWRASVQCPSHGHAKTENIEVQASHVGMGLNPSAWWAVADRLSQTPETWQPFKAPNMLGLQGLVFPNPGRP